MPVPCALCEMPLPSWELTGGAATCTRCGSTNQVQAFPAILHAGAAPVRAESALEGEAVCYDHPAKRAQAACGQCGRFVCALCAVDFGDAVWCPSCVAAGAGAARTVKGDTSRELYDTIALGVPLLALVFWPTVLIAAPASLFLTIAYWKRPLSLIRRSRWRFVAAAIVSSLELVGIVWAVVYFVLRARSGQS